MAFANMGLNLGFLAIAMAPFIPSMINDLKNPGVHTRVLVGAGSPDLNETNFDPEHKHTVKAGGKLTFGGPAPNIALFTSHGVRIGVYNSANGLGKSTTKIKEENTGHIDVPSFDKTNDETAEYMIMSGGGYDSLCVSVVSMTSAGTSDVYGFVPGEVASECNDKSKKDWPWYLSDRSIVIQDPVTQEEKTVRPRCLMIGSYGTVDEGGAGKEGTTKIIDPQVPYEGFQIHIPDFKQDLALWQSWQNHSDQMCNSQARFTMYKRINEMQCPQIFMPIPPETPIALPHPETAGCYPDHTQEDPFKDERVPYELALKLYDSTKRPYPQQIKDHYNSQIFAGTYARRSTALSKREQTTRLRKRLEENAELMGAESVPFHRHLVRSHREEHSAVALCRDPATVGPHFYSEREEMFCETDTHELFKRCESEGEEEGGCFDLQRERVRMPGDGLAVRDARPVYRRVQRWGSA